MNTNHQSTIYVKNVIALKNTQNKRQSLLTLSSNSHLSKPELASINTVHTFTKKVSELCTKHKDNKKWILIINSEDNSISTLQQQQEVDASRILHINNSKVKVNVKNVETALAKGNCSAVVLGENNFQTDQLDHLHSCAKLSNTTFVLLDKVSGLH